MTLTDTVCFVSTVRWPAIRTITLTPGHRPHVDTALAGLYDCRDCFDRGHGLTDHLDDSPCCVTDTEGPF